MVANTIYNFDEDHVKELATIELAYQIFKETKNPFHFNQLADEIKKIKQISSEKLYDVLPQLYTELNLDGRFLHLGKNEWALKSWYSVAKADEILHARDIEDDDEEIIELLDEEPIVPKKAKKASKAYKLNELDAIDDIDEDADDETDDLEIDDELRDEDLDEVLDEDLDEVLEKDLGEDLDEELSEELDEELADELADDLDEIIDDDLDFENDNDEDVSDDGIYYIDEEEDDEA